MCRGELGTEVDSGHVWRHGGVPDIGGCWSAAPILVGHVLLGSEVGWSSKVGLSFADKLGLESTGEGSSALDCTSVLVLVLSQPSQEGHSVLLQTSAASWGIPLTCDQLVTDLGIPTDSLSHANLLE